MESSILLLLFLLLLPLLLFILFLLHVDMSLHHPGIKLPSVRSSRRTKAFSQVRVARRTCRTTRCTFSFDFVVVVFLNRALTVLVGSFYILVV